MEMTELRDEEEEIIELLEQEDSPEYHKEDVSEATSSDLESQINDTIDHNSENQVTSEQNRLRIPHIEELNINERSLMRGDLLLTIALIVIGMTVGIGRFGGRYTLLQVGIWAISLFAVLCLKSLAMYWIRGVVAVNVGTVYRRLRGTGT